MLGAGSRGRARALTRSRRQPGRAATSNEISQLRHGWLIAFRGFASWTLAARSRTFRWLMTISVSDAQQRAKEYLQGFPPATLQAYLAYAETGESARLDEVVLGVLQFYLAKPPAAPLTELPGTTRLVADLGCDSLTMIDMMFLAENLFAVKLTGDDLAGIATLDELRAHFRKVVASATSGASA